MAEKLSFFLQLKKNGLLKKIESDATKNAQNKLSSDDIEIKRVESLKKIDKLPDSLKKDLDIISAYIRTYPGGIDTLDKEVVDMYVSASLDNFKKLPNAHKVEYLKKEPEKYIQTLTNEEVNELILVQENHSLFKHLPENLQKQIILSSPEIKNEITHSADNLAVRAGLIRFASSSVIAECMRIFNADPEKNNKYPNIDKIFGTTVEFKIISNNDLFALLDTDYQQYRKSVPQERLRREYLFSDVKRYEAVFDSFKHDCPSQETTPIEIQKKLAEHNVVKFDEKISTEVLLEFVGDNPMKFVMLSKKEVERLKEETTILDDKFAKKSNYNHNNPKVGIISLDIENYRESEILYATILEGMKMHDSYHQPVVEKIKELILSNVKNEKYQQILMDIINSPDEGITKEKEKRKDFRKKLQVLINEDIVSKVSEEELLRYLENPTKKGLVNILTQTYGEHVREIMESRPNFDLLQLGDLKIFHPKILELVGKEGINNALSYVDDGKEITIYSEIASNPELASDFEQFRNATKGMFNEESTVYDKNRQLLAFRDVAPVVHLLKGEEYTIERVVKLQRAIAYRNRLKIDIHDFSLDMNEAEYIPLKTLEDLDKFDERLNAIYDEAFASAANEDQIKEIISRRFFGMRYKSGDIEYSTQGSLEYLTKKLNLESFIQKYESMDQSRFNADELRLLKFVTLITKIKDVNQLKQIHNGFKEAGDLFLNPHDFEALQKRIIYEYSKELTDSLLTKDNIEEKLQQEQNVAEEKKLLQKGKKVALKFTQ